MLEENEEKIDFTKFTNSSGKNDQPIVSENIESVEKSTISYLKKHLGYIVLIISTIVLIDGIFFRVGLEDPLFYFAPFMIPIIGYGWIKNRIQHEFMRQFAKSNNFSYSEKGSLLGLNGTLFQVGHSKSISDVARGEHNGYQLTLFLYNYTTGYGKNSQTHQCTIFQLHFNSPMPSILLEKKGDYFGESLFGKIAENNFITLEGDFNKYFMLGVQEGYEIEALQIFTPDVMATLIDKAKSFSMEIVNNQLFIYANKTISTKQELENFYDLAEYFSHEIIPVLIRMKSSIEAMKKYTN